MTDDAIDETRISNSARSVNWLLTSFNNQNDQAVGEGKFINSIGTEISASAVDPVPEMPTIILMSIGLVGLGVYVWFKRKRQVLLAAS